MAFQPSVYQQNIFDWAKSGTGSALIQAVAGSGKTTTLMEMLPYLNGNVTILAFSNKIAAELAERIEKKGLDTSQYRASTFHSAGYSMLRYHNKNIKMDNNKVCTLIKELDIPLQYSTFVKKMVSMAKQWAIGFLYNVNSEKAWMTICDHFDYAQYLVDEEGELIEENAVEKGIKYAITILIENNNRPSIIDYDDMIYLPLILKLKAFRVDNLLIDESQDINPSRLELAKKLVKENGRVIAVGDGKQSIFGFAGSLPNAIETIKSAFNCVELPLTISYRCPKNVVAYAQQWVPYIKSAEAAIDGNVSTINDAQFRQILTTITTDDAILCRNNKPLIDLAYSFIRNGIGCRVEGRDIGKGLQNLIKKMGKKVTTLEDLSIKLNEYMLNETTKLMAQGKDAMVEMLTDKVETLLALIDQQDADATIQDLNNSIDQIFGDSSDGKKLVTLSSCHRSKGLEFRNVYWYGKNRWNPSFYAKKDWQMEQEINLMYVSATRAKEELIIVDVPLRNEE